MAIHSIQVGNPLALGDGGLLSESIRRWIAGESDPAIIFCFGADFGSNYQRARDNSSATMSRIDSALSAADIPISAAGNAPKSISTIVLSLLSR